MGSPKTLEDFILSGPAVICCCFVIIALAIYFLVVYVIIPAVVITSMIALSIGIIALIVGVIFGIFMGILCYGLSFYRNIFKGGRPIAKVVGVITIIGVVATAGYVGYSIYDQYSSGQLSFDSPNLDSLSQVSLPIDVSSIIPNSGSSAKSTSKATATPISGVKVEDITNPMKNMNPRESTTGTLLYSNSISFGSDISSYSLKINDNKPVTTINLQYIVEKITYHKTYTEKSTGKTKETDITVPNPDAGFEIIVYYTNGEVAYQTGYGKPVGKSSKSGYGNQDSGKISIYESGEFTIEMRGKDMTVNIQIVEAV